MSFRVLKALLWALSSIPVEDPRRDAASAPRLISSSASSSAQQKSVCFSEPKFDSCRHVSHFLIAAHLSI